MAKSPERNTKLIDFIDESIEEIKNDVSTISDDIENLSEQVKTLDESIDDIEDRNSDFEQFVADVNEQFTNIDDNISEIKKVLSEMDAEEKIEDIYEVIDDIKSNISNSINVNVFKETNDSFEQSIKANNESIKSIVARIEGLSIDDKFSTQESKFNELLKKLSDELTILDTRYRNVVMTGAAPVAVKNTSGTVNVQNVSTIEFSDGSVTDNGNGKVTVTTGGGGSSTFLDLTDTPSSYSGQAGKFPKVNAGETALEFVTISGGGDMLASTYDPANKSEQVLTISDIDDTAYDATSWNGVTDVAPSKNAVRDKIEALDSAKANTSHTHTASQITDFDTEVSNNTDVADNTSARHTHSNKTTLDNITAAFTTADETKLDGIESGAEVNVVDSVSDSSEIDFTITSRDLTASIITGSIDVLKLDSGVQASLALADSSLQPSDISDTAYDTASWNGVTDVAPSKNAVRDKIDSMDTAIALNTAKVTNATHTGEVTGSTTLTVDKTAISNRSDVAITASDYIVYGDASDSDNLKKDTVQGILDLVPAKYANIDIDLLNPTTGAKGVLMVENNATITGWTILSDASTSIVIDIWKDSYANYLPTVADTITGSEKPTLSSANKNQDLSLSTWTTSLSRYDILRYNVDSVTLGSATWVKLVIHTTLN